MSTPLPDPDFVPYDPEAAVAECVSWLEEELGRPLEPEQVERVFVDLLVYREALWVAQLREVAKQNLAAFARYPMLDYLGELISLTRLPAQPALCSLEFTFSAPLAAPLAIPGGFRVRDRAARVTFATSSPVTVGTGATSITVAAACTTAGLAGNGYAAGQISEPLDPLGVTFTVLNVTPTAGGASSESTDSYRDRFPGAVRGLSVAGPLAAYEALARSASSEIVDAAAFSPSPYELSLVVLAAEGVPSSELLQLVEDVLDPVEARPALDVVTVLPATPTTWTLEAQLELRKSRAGVEDTAADLASAQARAEGYADTLRTQLGQSPVRSQIIAALADPHVWRVTLVEPASDMTIAPGAWADCTSVLVSITGYEAT